MAYRFPRQSATHPKQLIQTTDICTLHVTQVTPTLSGGQLRVRPFYTMKNISDGYVPIMRMEIYP
jgi:hypothetical protein